MQIAMSKSGEDFPPMRRFGKGVSVTLWTAQGVLVALFLFAGVMKFVMPIEEMVKQSSLPGPFLHFIGIVEILGAIGLVLPALFRIWPLLTPIAACGLVIIMVGATVLSMPKGSVALFPLLVGVIAAFVSYGRFRSRPIQPRH